MNVCLMIPQNKNKMQIVYLKRKGEHCPLFYEGTVRPSQERSRLSQRDDSRIGRTITFLCLFDMLYQLSRWHVISAGTVACDISCHCGMWYQLPLWHVISAATVACDISCHCGVWYQLPLWHVISAATVECDISCHCDVWYQLPLWHLISTATVACDISCHCGVWYHLSLWHVISAATVACDFSCHCGVWYQLPLCRVKWAGTVACGISCHCMWRNPLCHPCLETVIYGAKLIVMWHTLLWARLQGSVGRCGRMWTCEG